MAITGRTTNKLFKIATYNPQNLYQVGVNGVTDITNNGDDYTITYELDDVIYKTNVSSLTSDQKTEKEGSPSTTIVDAALGRLSIVKMVDPILGNSESGQKNKRLDTTYEINGFSFDQFTENKIVKRDELVGLISKPITESELFIERDEFAIFERHQRISEINNLAALINYRGGYYEIVNTI
jgi:hypothetical protein